MMPDLGKYAFSVLLAYGGTIASLVGFIAVSVRSYRQSQKLLRKLEAERDG